MVYSDVIKNNYHLILPKRNKYTKRDWLYLLKESRSPPSECFFVVKCTAIYHDSQWSKFFDNQVNMMFG